MTIDEKREAIAEVCAKYPICEGCPINDSKYRCAAVDVGSDEIVEIHYGILFPNGVKEPTPTTNRVDHPTHYNREGAMECIDEMVLIFGKEAVKAFCLCNAWKYRYRAADKNGEEDLRKSDWYLSKYRELVDGD